MHEPARLPGKIPRRSIGDFRSAELIRPALGASQRRGRRLEIPRGCLAGSSKPSSRGVTLVSTDARGCERADKVASLFIARTFGRARRQTFITVYIRVRVSERKKKEKRASSISLFLPFFFSFLIYTCGRHSRPVASRRCARVLAFVVAFSNILIISEKAMKARGEIASHCARAPRYERVLCGRVVRAAASSLAPFPFAPIHQNS